MRALWREYVWLTRELWRQPAAPRHIRVLGKVFAVLWPIAAVGYVGAILFLVGWWIWDRL